MILLLKALLTVGISLNSTYSVQELYSCYEYESNVEEVTSCGSPIQTAEQDTETVHTSQCFTFTFFDSKAKYKFYLFPERYFNRIAFYYSYHPNHRYLFLSNRVLII